MIKKLFIIFTVMVAISILGTGAFNTAKAADFNIQLLSVVRYQGDIFIHNYEVGSGSLDISKISILNFGIDAALTVHPDPDDPEKIKVFPPGEGSLADGWLAGVPQLQVISVPAQSYTEANPLKLYISGSGGSVGDTAAHTKAGNKIETQIVDGPIPGLPVDASVPSNKIVVVYDVEYCIPIDTSTGCPDLDLIEEQGGIFPCDGGDPLEPDTTFFIGSENDPEGSGKPTIVQGEGDPRCPVGIAAHNPCTWVYIGGGFWGPYCW